MDPFVRRVDQTIRRYAMLARGDRVLVALSGGPDSTALLHALFDMREEWKIELVVGHFNHRLREDAEAVELLCRAGAERLGLPFVVGTSSSLRKSSGNVEGRARDERYNFLRKAAAELGCHKVATGHTADDQAETILLRLVRGSGIRGLAGVQPKRKDGVIRPLLELSRSEVLAFLQRRQLTFDQDPMNADLRFARNRIRLEVLPLLSSLNPRIAVALARLAEVARRYEVATQALLDQHFRTLTTSDGALNLQALHNVRGEARKLLLYRWLCWARQPGDRTGESFQRLEGLAERLPTLPHRLLDTERGLGILRNRNSLKTEAAYKLEAAWPPVPVALNELLPLPGGLVAGACLEAMQADDPVAHGLPSMGEWLALFDARSWKVGEWKFQPVRPGDWIDPLGMVGRKKMQDVFVDRKVPANVRWGRPALAQGGVLLWVPGLVRSRHALVVPGQTREVVKVWMAYPE